MLKFNALGKLGTSVRSSIKILSTTTRFYAANFKKPATVKAPLTNANIPHTKMRVVYNEEGQQKWEVMSKTEALLLAKRMDLDLVLVNGTSDPPVCKLENVAKKMMEKKKRQKEIKVQQKSRALKEILINALIDDHDFETKMNRVKDFLEDGHSVKLVIFTKYRRGKPPDYLKLDRVTLQMLESIETLPVVVQQQQKSPNMSDDDENPHHQNMPKREFVLNPKAKVP